MVSNQKRVIMARERYIISVLAIVRLFLMLHLKRYTTSPVFEIYQQSWVFWPLFFAYTLVSSSSPMYLFVFCSNCLWPCCETKQILWGQIYVRQRTIFFSRQNNKKVLKRNLRFHFFSCSVFQRLVLVGKQQVQLLLEEFLFEIILHLIN